MYTVSVLTVSLVTLISFIQFVNADISLYLQRDEVHKLLGLDVELYYIKDRKVNDYALKFVVPVPPTISELHFTWQSLTPMPYSISLSVNDISAIGTPTINITRRGNVPTKKQVFQIVLPCTGKVSAEVDVNIYINITMSPLSNVTQLTLKRKKICMKGFPQPSAIEEEQITSDAATIITSSKNSLYIGGISAFVIILLFGIISLVCYVRSHKGSNTDLTNSYGGATSHLSIGKTGQTFLSVDTPIHISNKNGSQYSSFTKLTTPSSAHRSLLNSQNTKLLLHHHHHHPPPPPHHHSQLQQQANFYPYQLTQQQLLAKQPLQQQQQQHHQIFIPSSVQNFVNKELTLNEQIIELSVDRKNVILKEKIQNGTFALIYSGLYVDDYDQVRNGDFSTDDDDFDVEGDEDEDDELENVYEEDEFDGEKMKLNVENKVNRNYMSNKKFKEKILVKTISDQASRLQVNLFLNEGMSFANCNHRNVLSVIGTCMEDPLRPLLIYPLMTDGNLKLYLQKCKFSSEGQLHTLCTQDLVLIALQIIDGIIYLHKHNIIHKDLGTRNCVLSIKNEINQFNHNKKEPSEDNKVFDDNQQQQQLTSLLQQTQYRSYLVKITDNALSRDLFPNDYHCLGDNENRPIKWLSLESLSRKEFNESTDVWSFGVTLWELLTLGQQPYIELDPFEVEAFLRDGYRLFRPINCPDNLYDIMKCCWKMNPNERPTFPQLLEFLREFYTALGKYI